MSTMRRTLVHLLIVQLVLLPSCISTAFLLSQSSIFARRNLHPLMLGNASLPVDPTLAHIHVNTHPPTVGKDIKLENGAKLWQLSMNASMADVREIKQSKVKEMAHSEPLKSDRSKETAMDTNLDYEDEDSHMAGSSKAPACASSGRHYCSFKENYPIEIVSKIAKYYKYPLESMFRDLQHQVMPTLAKDSAGGLVCDSATNLIRIGWAMNTNGRWLIVLNTEQYQQYITEVICRYRNGASCNFVPPCYRAKCLQRYNTQKLLVVDPAVPHKGPFLSEFIFPSCCVCHVESDKSYLLEEKKRA